VVAIPKAADRDHVRENVDATRIALDDATRAELNAAFPPPKRASRISVA
jgi:diketogulonate reductase-like aldo/keto reductase